MPILGLHPLRGALHDLGFDVARSTVQRILHDNGIEPAPRRGKILSWSAFLRAHWAAIAAADFFSVEVLTVGGLVRHFVFFVIDLETRRVHIAGVSNCPDGVWMAQIARNLTDAAHGFLKGARHRIVDRDPLYTAHFKEILASANVQLLRLLARSPNLNAYAERFVGSIKSECLRHIVPIGERHLRAVVREYVEHYHHERNHQGLETSSRCRSGNQARDRSDATNVLAAYWVTIGGRPHSAAVRGFGQDGVVVGVLARLEVRELTTETAGVGVMLTTMRERRS